jgi:hypothetical protein
VLNFVEKHPDAPEETSSILICPEKVAVGIAQSPFPIGILPSELAGRLRLRCELSRLAARNLPNDDILPQYLRAC